MSKHVNWIDLLSNALQINRTSLVILFLGITVQWISINGSYETVHREPFQSNQAVRSLMKRLDEARQCAL